MRQVQQCGTQTSVAHAGNTTEESETRAGAMLTMITLRILCLPHTTHV